MSNIFLRQQVLCPVLKVENKAKVGNISGPSRYVACTQVWWKVWCMRTCFKLSFLSPLSPLKQAVQYAVGKGYNSITKNMLWTQKILDSTPGTFTYRDTRLGKATAIPERGTVRTDNFELHGPMIWHGTRLLHLAMSYKHRSTHAPAMQAIYHFQLGN